MRYCPYVAMDSSRSGMSQSSGGRLLMTVPGEQLNPLELPGLSHVKIQQSLSEVRLPSRSFRKRQRHQSGAKHGLQHG